MLDVHSFVDAKLYKNDEEVIQDALRYLCVGVQSCAFGWRSIATRPRRSLWQKPPACPG